MATDLAKGEENVGVPIHGPRIKGEPMNAAAWYGSRDIRVIEVDRPAIAHPKDVILKVTSTAICGSDLHLYTGSFPRASMSKGDILGHEFMGEVFEIGEEVTGGYAGGQADYVRVPYAEMNLLKVPQNMHDLDLLLLSDVLATAWHATEMGQVGKDDTVAIWGAGPVGVLAAQCAQYRGAAKVVLIDQEQYRLDFAERRLDPRTLTCLNGRQNPVVATVREMLPHGPDICIEAVGFHYASSWLSKAEMALGLETDPADVMNEIFTAVCKGGRVSVVGVYIGYMNGLNFGAFMEKGLTMVAGQTPVQRYWKDLLAKVEAKELDPRIVITHEMPLEEAAEAYRIFNDKQDGCVKVVLHPKWYTANYGAGHQGKAGHEQPL